MHRSAPGGGGPPTNVGHMSPLEPATENAVHRRKLESLQVGEGRGPGLGEARGNGLAPKEREHLRDVLLTTPAVLKHLPEDTIHELFDANRYFGSSSGMIDKVLATARSAVATGVSTADSTLRRKK